MFNLWCEWGYSQQLPAPYKQLIDRSKTKIERMAGQLTI